MNLRLNIFISYLYFLHLFSRSTTATSTIVIKPQIYQQLKCVFANPKGLIGSFFGLDCAYTKWVVYVFVKSHHQCKVRLLSPFQRNFCFVGVFDR